MPVSWNDIVAELDKIDHQLGLMSGAGSVDQCKDLGGEIFEITKRLRSDGRGRRGHRGGISL